jgi:hypothetical protein
LRTPTTGRGLHPEITASTVHLWPLDDSAIGASSIDLIATGGALTFPGAPNDPNLLDGNIGKALAFDGTNDYVDGPTGDDATLRSSFSFDCWAYAFQGTSGPIATYTAAGELEADNTLFELSINSTGQLVWRHEHGAGSEVTGTTTAKIIFRAWNHIAFVKSVAATSSVDIYINGELAASFTGKTNATGGANSAWKFGTNEAGDYFDGSISSMRVTSTELAPSEIRSAFRRGMAWEPENFDCRLKVVIEQRPAGLGLLEINLSDFRGRDWVKSVEISDTIDAANRTASLRIFRDVFDRESMAPLMLDSPDNQATAGPPSPAEPGPDDLSYLPAIDLWHAIKIYAARMPESDGAAGSNDFQLIFEGRVDSIGWASDTVNLTCRDQIADLTDDIIQGTGNTYGTIGALTAVETVMQDILTAESPGPTTLFVPVSPSFSIRPYQVKAESIIDSLRTLSDLIGWSLRYRWDEDAATFKLTFYDPERDRETVDAVFEPVDYYSITRLDTNLEGVRNVVRIGWEDANGALHEKTVLASDVPPFTSTSITDYGRREMGLAGKATQYINNETEAVDMANAILNDLMEPYATQTAEMRIFWELTVGDRVTFQPNGVHYSTPLTGAIVAVRHRFEEGRATTSATLRGKPASALGRHLDKGGSARTGVYPAPGSLEQVTTGLSPRMRRIPTQVQIEQGLTAPLTVDASINTPNGYFSVHIDHDNQCFDGWTPGTGSTWGSTGDVYWSTTTHESGDRSLVLLTPGASVVSILFQPVINGRCMTLSCRWQGSQLTDSLVASVNWYDATRSLISSSVAFTQSPSIVNTFQTNSGTVAPPSNARFATISLEQASALPGTITIDRTHMTPTQPSFFGYLTTSQTAIAAGTAETVEIIDTQSESYDYCGDFDAATYSYTAPEAGRYRFSGKVTFAGNPSGTKIDNAHVTLYKNGSSWLDVESVEYDGGGSRGQIEIIWVTPPIHIEGGDVIKVVGQVNVDDFDILGGIAATWFAGELVRGRYS